MKTTLTLAFGLVALASSVAVHAAEDPGLKLANENACMTCHAIDHKVIGPPFHAIAQRFRNQPQAAAYLLARLQHGSTGDWGNTTMPPNAQSSAHDLQQLVQWVLAQ
ncbi:MAG: c-type cytochrome [Betaproteobacteria bacterium]|nr:c-type cytochrome [Betaproteobacteria bacterium]